MKTLLFLIVMALSSTCLAQDLGVGFMLGQPTGVSAKKFVPGGHAIDGAAAWSIGRHPHFLIHSDYLWNKTDALYFDDSKPLDLYFGLGGRIAFDDEIDIGVRFPVGLSHYFSERKAEAFAEVAPILNLVPSTDVLVDLAVGLRIYF